MTGSSCEELRSACAVIWDGLHAHPFLGELADGTLPLDKFRFFLEQDNLFLEEYARCLAFGAAKARSEVELRYFTSDLNTVLDAELPSNRELLARVIAMEAEDRGGSLAMAPANVAYTSYLTALALRGGPVEIMAALLPCAWSYVEIAEGLAGRRSDHPVYADWIGFFSSDEVIGLVAKMRRDFDALVAAERPGPARVDELREIFAMSSRLEERFWEMAYTLEQWPDLRVSGAAPQP